MRKAVRQLIFVVGYMKLVLIIILFPIIIYSQNGIIKGKVVDEVNEEKLLGANVILLGTKLGCATDIDGKYKIANVTSGKYILLCRDIGYKPEQQQIDIKEGEELLINFKLTRTEDYLLIVKDVTFFKKEKITIPPLAPFRSVELLPMHKLRNLEMKLLKKIYKSSKQ
jgi:hypothetical protein